MRDGKRAVRCSQALAQLHRYRNRLIAGDDCVRVAGRAQDPHGFSAVGCVTHSASLRSCRLTHSMLCTQKQGESLHAKRARFALATCEVVALCSYFAASSANCSSPCNAPKQVHSNALP
jgi:hypothetical protein